MQFSLPNVDGGAAAVAVATLGPQLQLKKNAFQGIVVPVTAIAALDATVLAVRAIPRLRRFGAFSYATRIRRPTAMHPNELRRQRQAAVAAAAASASPELDQGVNNDIHDNPMNTDPETSSSSSSNNNYNDTRPAKPAFRASEDPALHEDWEDDGERGIGDRLLHVLQRWQVENVLLVVARCDASLSGRLIGPELFKLVLEAAKLALEHYYVAHAPPTDAAKLELITATNGATTLVTPRTLPSSPPRRASVCVLSSETVGSWPRHHAPTSDGGGRHVAKRGRVNHFLHGRPGAPQASSKSPLKAEPASAPAAPVATTTGENQHETDDDDSDSGVAWLGLGAVEWRQLCALRVPVRELHCLLMCLVVLVDKPLEAQPPEHNPAGGPDAPTPYAWGRCREVLLQLRALGPRLQGLRGATLARSQVTALRAVFQEPAFTLAAIESLSPGAAKIFAWLQRLLDEHDEHELGIVAPPSPEPSAPSPSPSKSPSRRTSLLRGNATTTKAAGADDEDAVLARELNALMQIQPRPPRIVDRGRLLVRSNIGEDSRGPTAP